MLMVSQLCCDTAKSFSTDIPCPTEFIICAADDECGECLAFLEELTELNYNGQCEVRVCVHRERSIGQGGQESNRGMKCSRARSVAGCHRLCWCLEVHITTNRDQRMRGEKAHRKTGRELRRRGLSWNVTEDVRWCTSRQDSSAAAGKRLSCVCSAPPNGPKAPSWPRDSRCVFVSHPKIRFFVIFLSFVSGPVQHAVLFLQNALRQNPKPS